MDEGLKQHSKDAVNVLLFNVILSGKFALFWSQVVVFRGGVVCPMPNPQPGGPGADF